MQIILQMQSQLTTDSTSTNILKKPEHILSFVKHALEASLTSPQVTQGKRDTHRGLKLEDLRIIDVPDDEGELDGDSDDEDEKDIEDIDALLPVEFLSLIHI